MQHDSPTTVGIFILRRKILHNQKAAYEQAAFLLIKTRYNSDDSLKHGIYCIL